MNEKDLRFINSWQKHQARGKASYLIGYALIYALITGAISLLFKDGDISTIKLLQTTEFLGRLFLFTSIGLILAHFKWKNNNTRYEEIKNHTK